MRGTGGQRAGSRVALTARLALGAALLGALAACGGARTPGGGPAGTPSATAGSPARTAAPSASPAGPGGTLSPRPSSPAPSPSAPPPAVSPTPGSTRPTAPGTTVTPVTGALAGTDWTYIPTTRHVVALTFDAGANADAVPSILATLRREQVPATFFLTGDFVDSFPASARQIAAAGYRIGDHTLTHPHLTQLSDAAVRQEILAGAARISAVTGADPAPLLRLPFGDADARVISIANQAGYVPVRWTVDTLGWQGSAGGITPAVVVSRVLAGLRPGEIVLMHVGSNPDDHSTLDADALPTLISELRARGYSFVTLDALTG